MSKTIVAVIGCGRIAQNAHFPAFAQIPDLYVKYACDLIEEKAQAMKDKYPDLVGEVITDYKVALADPEVEAVFVLTPNFAHYTVSMDALRAGKNVMCEKPITTSYALSCEMAEEAKKQGKIMNIGVCNRYQSSVERLEKMNREGEFGKLYHVNCSFRAFRSIPGLGGDFTTKSQSGGGVLIDWGIHFLDLILYVLGGAKVRTASVINGTNDVDDFVTGHIRTDRGTITFTGAWAQNIERDEMYIDFLGDKKGARLDYCGQFHLTSGETLETVTTDHELENMYLKEDIAFLDSVKNGVKNKNYIDNILESMKLLDALYRSAELGKEVEV